MKAVKTVTDNEREAAQWCIELQDQIHMSEERHVEFIQWLRSDPDNEALLRKTEECWQDLGSIEVEPISVLDNNEKDFGFWKYASLAASFALVTIVTFYMSFWTASADKPNQYLTSTGEQKSFQLSDGSTITLNTRSEIHVDYNDEARRIAMLSGEVLYDVAHDPSRPFIVDTGAGEVTALGTRFNIRRKVNNTLVTLLEGKVEVETTVSGNPDYSRSSRQLTPGEQLSFSQSGTIGEVQYIAASDVIQWVDGGVSFSDIALSEVVEEVNRYSTKRLVIEGKAVHEERISAYFDVKNIDSLLFALREVYGIKHYTHSGRIYLYKPVEIK